MDYEEDSLASVVAEAEAGHVVAMCWAAWRLDESDPDQAIAWDRRAAELGYPTSMYNLGCRLAASQPDEARRWWERAAETGDASSMRALGNYYYRRILNPSRSRCWYERAVAAGDSYAMVRMGLLLDPLDIGPRFRLRRLREANDWYEKAAVSGEPHAQFIVGWRIVQWDTWGARISSSRRRAAQRWLEAAAEQGHEEAIGLLGQMLWINDPQAARRWLEDGTQRGYARCAAQLGLLVAGTDPEKGVAHFEQAREFGLQGPQKALIAFARRTSLIYTWLRRRKHSKVRRPANTDQTMERGPSPSSRRYWAIIGLTSESTFLARRLVRLALTEAKHRRSQRPGDKISA